MWNTLRGLDRNTVIGIVIVAVTLGTPLFIWARSVEQRMLEDAVKYAVARKLIEDLRADHVALVEKLKEAQIQLGILAARAK